ncbi:endonuclease 2 [Prunus yedoensis var. nudiflora]|uniref:Endonuclease 2 n=1 Tax=Prunus yedoensis var. nudiflora TaxID=2094558 RepID=A0A314YHT7_PRUYE|nr:endonuclease 2 [Prunus yedoensis var. nudiflora]
MGCGRIQIITLCSLLLLFPVSHGWGTVGHLTVCRIAQYNNNLTQALLFFPISLETSIRFTSQRQGRIIDVHWYHQEAKSSPCESN